MTDKVLFYKSCELLPTRKGIFKNPVEDTVGFRLLVKADELEKKRCKKEMEDDCDGADCTSCPYKDDCEDFDAEKGCRRQKKSVKPQRRRHWGEDPEYDAVMSNFGMTPGAPGEEVCQQLVFGWANVTLQEDGTTPFDWQGDTINTEVLESAAYNFVLNHGLANQEHEWGTECGWLVESMMFTKDKMAAMGIPDGVLPEGWFVGFYVPDPDVYKKVQSGEYNMFSIEGSAKRIPLDEQCAVDPKCLYQ